MPQTVCSSASSSVVDEFGLHLTSAVLNMGIGDGEGQGGPSPSMPNPPQWVIFFRQISCKIGAFVNFLGKYHVKFGHFVNFCVHIFSGKNVLPPKLTEPLCLWYLNPAVHISFSTSPSLVDISRHQ